MTATDTDAGKSWISAALLYQFNKIGIESVGMKPIASGSENTAEGLRNRDALLLLKYSATGYTYKDINHYTYAPAIAPHIAAEQIGVAISIETILKNFKKLQSHSELVVVEGVGGWMVPINRRQRIADLALALGLPVVVIVGLRLGSINHALLTIEAIKESGIPLMGWVGNCIDSEMEVQSENIQTLKDLVNIPCLGIVPHLDYFDPNLIAKHLEIEAILQRG